MTRGWIRLAVPAVSLSALIGVCCRLYDGKQTQDMIGCTSKCTLSPRELAERKSIVEASLGSKTLERTELDDGIAIRFPTDPQTIQDVFDFVTVERQCCGSFITFEVILNGGDGPFWVRLRGDEDAKVFLKKMFNVPAGPTIGSSSPG